MHWWRKKWRKKWFVDSILWPQLHKLYKPRRSSVISLITLGLWQFYTELAAGSINWRIFFLNVRKFSELRRLGSNLFHSEIVDGKKEFLKKLCFDLKMGKLCTFLVVYGVCNRNEMEKIFRMPVFKYVIKKAKVSVLMSKSQRY